MRAEQLKGHLDHLLLAILARAPAHGYAVAEALRVRSAGAIDLAEGTLYPALHRLESARALTSHWAVVDGRRRRIYSLTQRGRKALAQEAIGWESFTAGIRGVLQGAG
jgi:PadR family transcriptional regulator, regulatory protein PadR